MHTQTCMYTQTDQHTHTHTHTDTLTHRTHSIPCQSWGYLCNLGKTKATEQRHATFIVTGIGVADQVIIKEKKVGIGWGRWGGGRGEQPRRKFVEEETKTNTKQNKQKNEGR